MGSRSIFQHVCFCQDWREWLMLRFQPWRKKSSTLASASKADLLFSAPSNLSSRNIFHGILLTSDNYWTPKCCHDTVFFVLSAKLERQMSTIVELLPYFKNICPQTESEKLGVWLSRSIWRGRAPRFFFVFGIIKHPPLVATVLWCRKWIRWMWWMRISTVLMSTDVAVTRCPMSEAEIAANNAGKLGFEMCHND